MFPVTSKRFASSVNIPKRLIFGQHEIARQTPVNVARLPDMESIESRITPTLSIVSSPSPLPLESDDVGVGGFWESQPVCTFLDDDEDSRGWY